MRLRPRKPLPNGEPYPDFYLTAEETKVVALAAANGTSNIWLDVHYPDGTIVQEDFCGECGRRICHPSCPKVVRARANAT